MREPLRYHQPLHFALRAMLVIGASIPLFGFYDLLIRPGMSWFQWGMAPFLVIGLIALAMGLFFLSIAVFGGSRTVIVDRAQRACIVTFNGTFGIHRRFVHVFTSLGAVRVRELPSSDGPGHWAVELPRGEKAIILESYAEQERAREEAARVAAYMAGA
jgi:hypothetical protein